MSSFGFYDAGTIRQIATNLFYGWGYNFYRVENQLRADDQLVRGKAATLLGRAVTSISDAETEYRREFLPLPSRHKPFADASAIAAAQRLERLVHGIGALEALIQQQPVPANDRMTERYRKEAPTLETLVHYDEQLVGQCDLLRSLVTGKDAASILQMMPELETGLEAIQTTLRNREAVLLNRVL